jgi:hypothetical protein
VLGPEDALVEAVFEVLPRPLPPRLGLGHKTGVTPSARQTQTTTGRRRRMRWMNQLSSLSRSGMPSRRETRGSERAVSRSLLL